MGIILIVNFLMHLKFKGEKMEHDGERTEFGGARRAENGLVKFLHLAKVLGTLSYSVGAHP